MSEHDDQQEQHGQSTSEDVIVPLDVEAMLADEAPASDVDTNLQAAIDAVARDLDRESGSDGEQHEDQHGDHGDPRRDDGSATGAESKDQVRTALRAQLERHGVWPQPEPWLDSVIDSLVTGHPYRVLPA